MFVGPEFACGADAGLDFVDNKQDVVFLGDGAEAAEEEGGGVVVAALGLDGLDDDGYRGVVVFLDETLCFVKAALFLLSVFSFVLSEWVFEGGEGCLRPVEGRDVELVDGLGACGGETAKEAAVEARLEGHDGHVGGTGRLVDHGRGNVFGGKVGICSSTLLLALPHKGCLVGEFIGVGASLGGEDLVETFGCNREDSTFEDIRPVVLRKVAESGTVDNGRGHFG